MADSDKVLHTVSTVQYTKQDVVDLIEKTTDSIIRIITAVAALKMKDEAAASLRRMAESENDSKVS